MIRSKMLFLLVCASVTISACGQQDGDRPATPPAAEAPVVEAPQTTAGPGAFSGIALPPLEQRSRVRCSVDKIGTSAARGQTVTVESGANVLFGGWVADSQRQVPGSLTVVLSGAGNYGVTGKAGVRRNDVARSLGSPALATSGFDVKATLAEVPPGQYGVGILVADQGKNVLCTTSSTLVVTASSSG